MTLAKGVVPPLAKRPAPPDAKDLAPVSRSVLERVYQANFAFVRRNLARLGVPRAHLDDATHDVFVVLVRRGTDLGPVHSVRGLLFAIATKVAANHRRRHGRLARHRVTLQTLRPTVTADDSSRIEAAMVVQRFLATLDDPTRAVFTLADLEGMSGPEIAAALGGISVNTVYSRIRSARAKFTKYLANHGLEPHGGPS